MYSSLAAIKLIGSIVRVTCSSINDADEDQYEDESQDQDKGNVF